MGPSRSRGSLAVRAEEAHHARSVTEVGKVCRPETLQCMASCVPSLRQLPVGRRTGGISHVLVA